MPFFQEETLLYVSWSESTVWLFFFFREDLPWTTIGAWGEKMVSVSSEMYIWLNAIVLYSLLYLDKTLVKSWTMLLFIFLAEEILTHIFYEGCESNNPISTTIGRTIQLLSLLPTF